MKKLICIAPLLFTACATGVMNVGDNLYTNSKQGWFALIPTGSIKTDLIEEAKEFCRKDNKNMELVNSSEQVGSLGRSLPEVHLKFKCVQK